MLCRSLIIVFVSLVAATDSYAQASVSVNQLGTIRGRVVSLETGASLRRARVILAGGGLKDTRMIATDFDNGWKSSITWARNKPIRLRPSRYRLGPH